MSFPEIVDIVLPAEGVFHNLAFVSVRKTFGRAPDDVYQDSFKVIAKV